MVRLPKLSGFLHVEVTLAWNIIIDSSPHSHAKHSHELTHRWLTDVAQLIKASPPRPDWWDATFECRRGSGGDAVLLPFPPFVMFNTREEGTGAQTAPQSSSCGFWKARNVSPPQSRIRNSRLRRTEERELVKTRQSLPPLEVPPESERRRRARI